MYILSALLLLTLSNLIAYPCPEAYWEDEKLQRSHAWLERFKGDFELHGCHVEITVCNPDSGLDPAAPLGEVWLKTPDGREAYVSLDFLPQTNLKISTQARLYPRTLNYQKRDLHYEEVNGRTEFWQLELRTLWDDLDTLDHIDLGIYTTNSRLNQANGNQSHWFNCNTPKIESSRRGHM